MKTAELRMIPVSELKPAEYNPRKKLKPGDKEYEKIKNSIEEFGFADADGKRHMIFDHFDWVRDGKDIPKIHPSQKPVNLLKRLIGISTDEGDVVIDPCAGSGSTLRAAREMGRNSYGFEVSRDFYAKACEQMLGGAG